MAGAFEIAIEPLTEQGSRPFGRIVAALGPTPVSSKVASAFESTSLDLNVSA